MNLSPEIMLQIGSVLFLAAAFVSTTRSNIAALKQSDESQDKRTAKLEKALEGIQSNCTIHREITNAILRRDRGQVPSEAPDDERPGADAV
jgi:hypothetical protein